MSENTKEQTQRVAVMAVMDALITDLDYSDPHDRLEKAKEARAAVADLIASQKKSREVLRNIVRDKKGGIHYAAAQAACHQANAALAGVGGDA